MYDFNKAILEKRYSECGVKVVKQFLDFYNREETKENIEPKFFEYGIGMHNTYPKFVKRFGKKFTETAKKDSTDEWIPEDWMALNDIIEKTSSFIDLVELSNNNIILVYD